MDHKFHDWRTAPTHTVSTPAVSELAKRLAFPVAYSMGGTGWGPLGAVIITAGLAGGFWAGWLLGWLALRAR